MLTSAEYAAAFEKGQLQAMAFVFLNAQSSGYALGMVFFGLHLGVLGTWFTGLASCPGSWAS